MRTRRSQLSSNQVSAPDAEGHQSVLLHEALELLDVESGDTAVDATLGGAGHAHAIAEQLGPEGLLIGFDADSAAIERARTRLKGVKPTVELINRNFRHLGEELDRHEDPKADAFLFDLGWSSFQLAAGRGFSFGSDEPLLMTYAAEVDESEVTAADIVNDWAEESIADILYGWGEERYARRIAKRIVEARAAGRIETAAQLAEIIRSAVPPAYARGRTHPATKSFQAIRIATNDELGALSDALAAVQAHAREGARLAVISFHSLEDRLVKQTLKAWAAAGKGEILTKKPRTPSAEEVARNPRARSAKLRAFHFDSN